MKKLESKVDMLDHLMSYRVGNWFDQSDEAKTIILHLRNS